MKRARSFRDIRKAYKIWIRKYKRRQTVWVKLGRKFESKSKVAVSKRRFGSTLSKPLQPDGGVLLAFTYHWALLRVPIESTRRLCGPQDRSALQPLRESELGLPQYSYNAECVWAELLWRQQLPHGFEQGKGIKWPAEWPSAGQIRKADLTRAISYVIPHDLPRTEVRWPVKQWNQQLDRLPFHPLEDQLSPSHKPTV